MAIELHQNNGFRNAKIGLKKQAQHNNTIRTDEICWLDDQSSNPSIQLYLDQTKQIAQILNQSLFIGLSDFETHFAVYQSGTYYKKHVDQFVDTKDRKISCVYYLNQDWQEDFGGELKLYNLQDQLVQIVHPHGNRFVFFNSELPHEVCLTQQTRFSIAGWMKTRSMFLFD